MSDYGVVENASASQDTGSVGSGVSNHSENTDYGTDLLVSSICLDEDRCRAIFTDRNGRQLVCHHLAATCKRTAGGTSHVLLRGSHSTRAVAGHYRRVLNKAGEITGGNAREFIDPQVIDLAEEAVRDRNAALASQFFTPGKSSAPDLPAATPTKPKISPGPSVLRTDVKEESVSLSRPEQLLYTASKSFNPHKQLSKLKAEVTQQQQDQTAALATLAASIESLKQENAASIKSLKQDSVEQGNNFGTILGLVEQLYKKRHQESVDAALNLKAPVPDSKPAAVPSGSGSSSGSRKKRLYVIGHGHLSPRSVGFYDDSWDRVRQLTDNCSRARYAKVKDEDHGFRWLEQFFKDRKSRVPNWVLRKRPHYPDLDFLLAELETSDDGSFSAASSSTSLNALLEAAELSVPEAAATRAAAVSAPPTDPPAHTVMDDLLTIEPDPSQKKDDELFGVSLDNPSVLVKSLTPPGLTEGVQQRFFDQIVDVASLPKHEGTLERSNDTSVDVFVQAVSHLATERDENNGQTGHVDTGYRNGDRTALKFLTSEEKLRKAASFLHNQQYPIQRRFLGSLTGVLIGAGFTANSARRIAKGSLAFRIGQDSYDLYNNLLHHLLGVLASSNWTECKHQIAFHSENLTTIRSSYYTRAQVISGIYIYLRDGCVKHWTDIKLITAGFTRFQEEMTKAIKSGTGGGGTASGGPGFTLCKHCKAGVHGGGKQFCPWKDLSHEEAREAGAAALRSLSTKGGGAGGGKAGGKKKKGKKREESKDDDDAAASGAESD